LDGAKEVAAHKVVAASRALLKVRDGTRIASLIPCGNFLSAGAIVAGAPRRLQEFIDSCINGCVSARMKTMRRRIALSKHLVGVVSKEGVADGVEDETAPLSQCFEEESGTLAKKFAFGSSPSEVKRITTRAAFVSSTDWPPTLPIVGESVNL